MEGYDVPPYLRKAASRIWGAIEACFPIDDTVWLPGEWTTLFEELILALDEMAQNLRRDPLSAEPEKEMEVIKE